MILPVSLLLLSAYLLGSVPSALWIGKVFYQTDVRKFGSGNAGATNAMRVLGKKAGICVLLFDAAKGFVATSLGACYTFQPVFNPEAALNFQIALGSGAVLGHVFPVFAQFKGGKGVATLLGMGLAIHLPATLLCLLVFGLVFWITQYVSLASMLASLAFPLLIIFVFQQTICAMILFSVAVTILVLLTHQKNLRRLCNGTEPKTPLYNKPTSY